VRLTEAHLHSDPVKPKQWRRLRKNIDRTLDQLGRSSFQPELLIGSGGTFTNIAEMVMADREGQTAPAHGYAITRSELDGLVARLRKMPLEVRREMPGLNPKRADIIVAGAAAVARLARRLHVRRILVNERGIRDGLVLSMIGDHAAPAVIPNRTESVVAFARKCRSNERHNGHVAKLSGQLFDGLRRRLELPPDTRDLLVAAALLHDVGALISHAGRHKHAYHLIVHGDIRGFSGREIQIIANVARYHRGASPRKRHANLSSLRKNDRRLVRSLAGMLRVAVGLDRTHTQRVAALRCAWRAGTLRLVLDAPSDPQVEIDEAMRKADLLSRMLDGVVTMTWPRKRRRLRILRSHAA
jgi:exopolyphosphatase/guanosine-5'-triphosphate,3'-diphosphate pyrophosphatase